MADILSHQEYLGHTINFKTYKKSYKSKKKMQNAHRIGRFSRIPTRLLLTKKPKNEMFYGHEYEFKTLDELEIAMKGYIKYYNTQRITVKLKGLTPVLYGNQS